MWTKARTRAWRELATARGRREQDAFLAEGFRAIAQGAEAGVLPEEIVFDRGALGNPRLAPLLEKVRVGGGAIVELPGHVVRRLSQTVHGQGVLARYRRPRASACTEGARTLVLLDRLQDPGNVGLVVRHATAFGADALWLLPDCADPFSPKAVRASAGGIFQTPCAQLGSAEEARERLASAGFEIWVLRAGGADPLWRISQPEKLGLVVGSEAHGPGPEWENQPGVRIPQSERIESCNAGFAASMVLAWRYGTRKG